MGRGVPFTTLIQFNKERPFFFLPSIFVGSSLRCFWICMAPAVEASIILEGSASAAPTSGQMTPRWWPLQKGRSKPRRNPAGP